MLSVQQTNPHTHSARFQATEIRMNMNTRLVRDSSEVSATISEPETVSGSYSTRRPLRFAEKGSAYSTHAYPRA